MTIMEMITGKKNVAENTASKNEKSLEDRLFENINANTQTIGRKKYAYIPLDILKIDASYQRTETFNKEKVKDLITNFDTSKMDTLMVSIHPEEKRYYIIDGMHRFLAAKELNFESIECEIIEISGTPEERRKEEAARFISQQILIDKMTPLDQHKGHIICGDKEYIELDKIVNSFNGLIQFKTNKNRGKQPEGTITGYMECVRGIKRYGKDIIKDTFDILIAAGWNKKGTGLGNYSIKMVAEVLYTHKENTKVKAELARIIKEYDPSLFRAIAHGYYKMRSNSNAYALYLEDLVCANLNIPRLIDLDVKERYNPAV